MNNLSGKADWVSPIKEVKKPVKENIIKTPLIVETTSLENTLKEYQELYNTRANKYLGDAILHLTNSIELLKKVN